MNDAAVVVRKVFPASRERLFRAWSDPQELIEWFSPEGFRNPSVEADVHSGGTFRIAMQKLPDGEPFFVSGRYRSVEPPSRLVFTWTWEDPAEKVRDTLVTVEFLEREAGTEIVLTHELLPEERRDSHAQGWEALLSKLQETIDRETEGEQ